MLYVRMVVLSVCFLFYFLVLLFFQNLNKTTTVSDVSTLHSMPVFSLYVMTLHYLKNHAIRMINRHVETYNEDDVSYAVIVPTTADDRSKWFVRQAAVKVYTCRSSLRKRIHCYARYRIFSRSWHYRV